MSPDDEPLGVAQLRARFAQAGRVTWLGLRPARAEPMREVERAVAHEARGLEGDRASTKRGGARQLSLLQAEHLPVIAALAGLDAPPAPALLRRNVLVAGINLLALRKRRFRIGNVVLEGGADCHPCSRMEAALGPGGYNAMRGHGGILARVLEGGELYIGAEVVALDT